MTRNELTALGTIAFDRARAETERRHKLKGAALTKRDLIALGCDIRIIGRGYVGNFTVHRAKEATKVAYEKYAECIVGEQSMPPNATSFVDGLRLPAARKKDAPLAFEEAWKNWVDLSNGGIDWLVKFPELKTKKDEEGNPLINSLEDLDPIRDLLTLDVIPLYHKLREHTATLGVLPDLALAYIGANLASSFCERVNSAAKLIMTHDRTTLGNKHLEMLCVLRMNRDFIAWMREHHDDWCREWYQKTLQKLM